MSFPNLHFYLTNVFDPHRETKNKPHEQEDSFPARSGIIGGRKTSRMGCWMRNWVRTVNAPGPTMPPKTIARARRMALNLSAERHSVPRHPPRNKACADEDYRWQRLRESHGAITL